MEAAHVALELAAILVAFAVGWVISWRVNRGRVQLVPMAPSAALLEELGTLRHLKAQLDNPPQAHNHVWPREPDIRKMGWLRYRCAYAGCPAIDWRPS